MAGASIIEVDGVQILHLDFVGITIEQAPALLEACGALVRSQPLDSAFTLSDFTGAHFDSNITVQLREYTKANRPHVHFGAVVGITGIKRAVYRAMLLFSGRTNLVLCDTVDEAKRVLVNAALQRR
ncbi:MAG: hypothetical protein DI536_09075 [Archangium gephyra]|uniref:STAS domain-containing protein n=1 Tax=Archangium gephyra TaxID=48 RepID=A0A2W5TQR0_9BACT|nr:MAG: hypothetical protein DI536_09075 [Archangium gephyra]